MSAPHQILLYGREHGEAFLARARAHALAHHPGLQIVQRHPNYFGWDGCEITAAIVYVEARYAGIIADYRGRGVPVFTEADIGVRDEGIQDQGRQVAAPDGGNTGQEHVDADGQGPPDGGAQDAEGHGQLGSVTPIATARRRGRPRKVA